MIAGPGQHFPSSTPIIDRTSLAGQAPWQLPRLAVTSGLAADAARLGDLDIRAASVVGTGHRCADPALPRQDAYALGRTTDGQYLVVCVADGVSASSRSDLGARVAVSAAARETAKFLDSGQAPEAIIPAELFGSVAAEMVGTGRSRGLQDRDVCSILIVAVIPTIPAADGSRRVWTAQIGDVSLWLCRQNALHQLTGPTKSGMDKNILDGVLPHNWDQVSHEVFDTRSCDRIAVMTDGISETLVNIRGGAAYFSERWSGAPPHPADFAHSLCYDAPGQSDDRTAVVVWCGSDGQGTSAFRPSVAS